MQTKDDEIRIGEASFPKPFSNGLEFNAPVHGNWNIVHIGMQMPEAVQIYVCAKNCMRGVVLTAAEMNAADRFSFVILNEEDMVRGKIDEVTADGVIDVIRKRLAAGMPAKAVIVFPVCVHHFLGTDLGNIYNKLEQAFPNIDFYRAYMDPIMQKKGYTPDQKLRRAMLAHLKDGAPDARTASILGNNFRLEDDSDITRILKANGYELRQAQDCRTYEEFLQLGKSELFLCVSPPALMGAKEAAGRRGRPFLYLPSSFDLSEIKAQRNALLDALGEGAVLPAELAADDGALSADLAALAGKIGNTEVTIDYMVHPRPLGLALLLAECGINVSKVFLDAVSTEEEKAFSRLQEIRPDLLLSATIHVRKRTYVSGGRSFSPSGAGRILAAGPKAAYFSDTPYFVNMVEGFGLQGISGIRKMIALLSEAFEEEKDTRDLVPRKGLGCESCL